MSIFSTLNTGVSGLQAAETQLATTSHNITNANSTHYTRQRVVQQATDAFHTPQGDIGMGTTIHTIVRIHDEFVYTKLKNSESALENTKYMQRFLQEVAHNYPDLKDMDTANSGVGILRDLQRYQKAWNDFASNPTDGSMKINLVKTATTLTESIKRTKEKLSSLQKTVNDEIELTVKEINQTAKDIAAINQQIANAEGTKFVNANDLRDKRDELELKLSKLVGFDVSKGGISQDSRFENTMSDGGRDYNINVSGISLVDGVHFTPLKLDDVRGETPFHNIYHDMEDGTRINLTTKISGGKLGAQLDLRGRFYNDHKEKFNDGYLQDFIDDIDNLASTIMVETNNIYAKAATSSMESKPLKGMDKDMSLANFSDKIKNGSFDLVVYNNQGEEVARKTININSVTTFDSTNNANSIVDQINANTDDNKDNNPLNDFDDYFKAAYTYDSETKQGVFTLLPKDNSGFKVSIEDHGTNFPGVFELSGFFSGNDASDMSVESTIAKDPMSIRASSSGADGNNDIANDMLELQYQKVNFGTGDNPNEMTFEGYYRYMTTKIASITENNNNLNDTNTIIHETVSAEFHSISGVNMNEELSNLIRFQTSYGAAAKVITTIDKMLDTLLTIKQ